MAATTTHSITSIHKRLIADYSQFRFAPSDRATWSPDENTVYYEDRITPETLLTLMHEIGHAVLDHRSYRQDIELIQMERDAWSAAVTIGNHYGVEIDDDAIESALDSYRDWLHARSRCPQCESAGLQTLRGAYRCVLCRTSWHTNDARLCGLKRYRIKK